MIGPRRREKAEHAAGWDNDAGRVEEQGGSGREAGEEGTVGMDVDEGRGSAAP